MISRRIMSEEMLQLDLEIQILVDELKQLTKTIPEVDDTFMTDPSENNKLFLFETVDRYKEVIRKLRINLEAYFAEENKAMVPIDMLYRKLYKKLQKAY